jgi:hypothetical protein
VPAKVIAQIAPGIARQRGWQARVATPLAQIYASRPLWGPIGVRFSSLAVNLIGAHGAVIEAMFGLLAVASPVMADAPPAPSDASSIFPPDPGIKSGTSRRAPDP